MNRRTVYHAEPEGAAPASASDGVSSVDAEELLTRIDAAPGSVAWVAIPFQQEDRHQLARQFQESDPSLPVVLLGADDSRTDRAHRILHALSADSSRGQVSDEPALDEGSLLLHEAERRVSEAEKLAAITGLTAGLAHELGTPMTSILGYAELLAKSVTDEKNRRRAAIIIEQVHRVRAMIETLLNLSRVDETPPIAVELGSLVEDALELLRESLDRRRITAESSAQKPLLALGNPHRLHVALVSLFRWALEGIPEHGVLRISLANTEEGARLSISLPANGSKPNPRARSFERSSGSALADDSAKNLSLYVARTLISEHGGNLDLAIETEQGTELRITLRGVDSEASEGTATDV